MAKDNKQKEGAKLMIDKIENVFTDINLKIQSLHDCSNNDFFALNESFKRNYSYSKQVSENSKKLIGLLSDKGSLMMNEKIEELGKNINNHFLYFKEELQKYQNILTLIEENSNQVQLPLKHIIQNLLTFSFVISSYNVINTLKQINPVKLNELAGKLKMLTERLINQTETLRSRSVQMRKTASELTDQLIIISEDIKNKLSDSALLFSDKEKEVNEGMKEIDLKYELTESINNIITNLQYHDILKQKMEHIQKIHESVIERIQQLRLKGQQLENADQISDCLLYVSEITELQSAQLLHVNKKYQLAIRIISENILAISQNVNIISRKTHDIFNYNSNTYTHFLNHIYDNLSAANNQYFDFVNHFKSLVEDLKEYLFLHDEIRNDLALLKTQGDQFLTHAASIIKDIAGEDSANRFSVIINQLENLSEDTINFKNEIQEKLARILQHVHAISICYNENEVITKRNKFTGFSDNLFDRLKEVVRESGVLLLENENLSRQIGNDIGQSLKQVRYYKFFEKKIDEITSKLDELNSIIMENIRNNLDSRNIDIDNLKKIYTTKSEHQIHDIFVEKGSEKSKNFDDHGKELEGDSIELF